MPLVHPLELLTSSRLWLALPQLLVPFEAIEVETRTPIELSGALRRV